MRTYGSQVLDLGVARAPGVVAPASIGRNERREGGGRSFTETRTRACTAAVGASARWIFMISSAFSAFRMVNSFRYSDLCHLGQFIDDIDY